MNDNEQLDVEQRTENTIQDIKEAIEDKEDQVKKRMTKVQESNVKDGEKIPKEPKPSTKNEPTGDIVKLKDICDELGIDPSKARRVLRKHEDNIKPTGKWEWDKKEHEDIIAQVKKLLGA